MLVAVTMLLSALPADVVTVEHRMIQLSPARKTQFERSLERRRAVLLVHGLRFGAAGHDVTDATPSDWQEPDSRVVRALAAHADVFAFAYGQNDAAHRIAPALKVHVRDLRKLGYTEVVLVGHSTGGILVRHFVEDNPDAGVTKAIQVACPNAGCPSASDIEPDKRQRRFIESITKAGRRAVLEQRQQVRIPEKIQFVCIVGKMRGFKSDFVVPVRCQWTADLQEQGIPCLVLGTTTHMSAMEEEPTARLLDAVIRCDCPRWTSERIAAARRALFTD